MPHNKTYFNGLLNKVKEIILRNQPHVHIQYSVLKALKTS